MENRIASTRLNNSVSRGGLIANDIIEVVSELGNVDSAQLSPIGASGGSGLGNLTATLQVQGGANVLSRELEENGINTIDSLQGIEYYVDAPPTLPIISDGRSPTFVQFESFEAPTYSVHNDTLGELLMIMEHM